MIAVLDVGLGNVSSVGNMLRRIGAEVVSPASPEDWDGRCPIVLPGVGAFDSGVARLKDSGWFDVLKSLPSEHPVLGICLGMQLLGVSSEEGQMTGLSRVPARFTRIPPSSLPVPHMGWNEIRWDKSDPVFGMLPDRCRFYFTHSYRAICEDDTEVVAIADYGIEVVAAYRCGGTYGTQFHPEKSHRFGMALMQSWVASAC